MQSRLHLQEAIPFIRTVPACFSTCLKATNGFRSCVIYSYNHPPQYLRIPAFDAIKPATRARIDRVFLLLITLHSRMSFAQAGMKKPPGTLPAASIPSGGPQWTRFELKLTEMFPTSQFVKCVHGMAPKYTLNAETTRKSDVNLSDDILFCPWSANPDPTTLPEPPLLMHQFHHSRTERSRLPKQAASPGNCSHPKAR